MKRDNEAITELKDQGSTTIVQEFFLYMRETRKWWLLPILLVVGLLSLIVVLASTGAAPYIYTIF